MTPHLRIWCEHLPLDLLARRDTLDLLSSGPLHPLIAVQPSHDLDQLAHALQALDARGLEAGIWPLLPDSLGYWPGEQNAEPYWAHVSSLLHALHARRAPVRWLAVDLEPPLHQINALRHNATPSLEAWRALKQLARDNLDPPRFARSLDAYTAGLAIAQTLRVKTLAVTLPTAAHDLRDGLPIWQDLFEAPWEGIPWDRAGIMAYGSMVSGYSRGLLSHADARAIHYRLFLHIARRFGHRSHAALGITGPGKLGDEPSYTRPDQLARDASAALAAGIHDLSFFCLEGLLGRPDAGAWVQALRHATPQAPRITPRALLIRQAAAATRHLLRRTLGATK